MTETDCVTLTHNFWGTTLRTLHSTFQNATYCETLDVLVDVGILNAPHCTSGEKYVVNNTADQGKK